MSNSEPYFPMRYGLRQKPRPRQMAKILGRSIAEVCGALGFVWEFAHEQLPAVGDRVHWCDADDIDKLAEIPGFADAMVKAGYLILGQGWVEFPGYNDLCKGPGSHAYHDQQKKERTFHATAQRVANRAKEEQKGARPNKVTTNATDNVTLHVTDNVTSDVEGNVTDHNNKYKNNNKNKNNVTPPLPPAGGNSDFESTSPPPAKKFNPLTDIEFPYQSDEWNAAWGDWVQHRRELRKPLTPKSTLKQIIELGAMGEGRAIAALARSIKNSWVGIFEPNETKTTHPPRPSSHAAAMQAADESAERVRSGKSDITNMVLEMALRTKEQQNAI